jgi:hypothetical protein
MTLSLLLPRENPCNPAIALAAECGASNDTKPKPRLICVRRSRYTRAVNTVPNGANNCVRAASSTVEGKLYTKAFVSELMFECAGELGAELNGEEAETDAAAAAADAAAATAADTPTCEFAN